MSVSISPDQMQKLNQALILHKTMLRKDANEILVKHARLLVKDLVKYTYPLGDGETTMKTQGENAVERDINKSVTPFNTDGITNPELKKRLDKIAKQKDIAGLKAIISHIPKLKKYDVVPFSPDLHLKARLHGDRLRVNNSQNKFTLDKKEWRDYLKKMKERVGSLKASWGSAITQLGLSFPNWIMKNVERMGRFSSCKIQLGDKPSIVIENSAHPQSYLQKAMNRAVDGRVGAMIRDLREKIKRRK